ncbi:MAG: phosphate ABC transporter permease subunit PstC [Opitutaceae bacterium]
MPVKHPSSAPSFLRNRARIRILGLTVDDMIRAFFGGNALVSVVVLALITIFLFKEGYSFFGDNHRNLQTYRRAGLEYVDIMRAQLQEHVALTRQLSDLRLRQFRHLTEAEGRTLAQANEALAAFDEFSGGFSDTAIDLRGLVADLSDQAVATKTQFIVNQDKAVQQAQLLAANKLDEAAAVQIDPVDFATAAQVLTGTLDYYRQLNETFAQALRDALANAPPMPAPEQEARMDGFKELVAQYVASFPDVERKLEAWNFQEPVPFAQAFTAFIFGTEWITASFWQDWYGIMPLLTGSLLVSAIALFFAIPMGVGSAIYINQIAGAREQRIIKPCIEFIAAIPSVVLGFFGIAVLGESLRALSGVEWLSWVPGFPFSERLNALTAGCLLALIAVPTIFTLAEDALNNVPRALKESSLALGATRLQTITRIVVPASLSGIISAVLLGLGRVFGETMVVLLCAGNRIQIPDISKGLGIVTEPVHTMTGIIAQEMGEVVRGGIHYRALFCAGIVLFFLSLLINYMAQKIVHRYRLPAA